MEEIDATVCCILFCSCFLRGLLQIVRKEDGVVVRNVPCNVTGMSLDFPDKKQDIIYLHFKLCVGCLLGGCRAVVSSVSKVHCKLLRFLSCSCDNNCY
jgi:hypothetical protein